MKLLQSLDDIGTSLTIRPTANEALGDLGPGRSKIEKNGRSRSERRQFQTSPLSLGYWILCAICVLSTLVVSADAADPGERHGRRWRHNNVVSQYEEILLDHSPMPTPSYGMLGKRQDDPSVSDQRSPSSSLERPSFAPTAEAVDETDTARTDVVGPDETPSTTSISDPSSTSTPEAPTENFVLPKPFDAGLGTNYTQPSCPTFLRSMINNETFSACLPLSLLLQVCRSLPSGSSGELRSRRTPSRSSKPRGKETRSIRPSRLRVTWCSPHAAPSWLRSLSNSGRAAIASRIGNDKTFSSRRPITG